MKENLHYEKTIKKFLVSNQLICEKREDVLFTKVEAALKFILSDFFIWLIFYSSIEVFLIVEAMYQFPSL